MRIYRIHQQGDNQENENNDQIKKGFEYNLYGEALFYKPRSEITDLQNTGKHTHHQAQSWDGKNVCCKFVLIPHRRIVVQISKNAFFQHAINQTKNKPQYSERNNTANISSGFR